MPANYDCPVTTTVGGRTYKCNRNKGHTGPHAFTAAARTRAVKRTASLRAKKIASTKRKSK